MSVEFLISLKINHIDLYVNNNNNNNPMWLCAPPQVSHFPSLLEPQSVSGKRASLSLRVIKKYMMMLYGKRSTVSIE